MFDNTLARIETITLVPLDKIDPSPYQPESRVTFTPAELADIITVQGADPHFIDVPRVRLHPTKPGRYEMVSGHRRMAAWALAQPDKLMPCIVQAPKAERMVFTDLVIANEGRANFNAIQKADLLAKGIELGMSQEEAGKLFNPPLDKTAVSHLISLRRLPDEIKVHVESGAIAERHARALVTVAKHNELAAIKAAQSIAQAKPEEKEGATRIAIQDAYRKTGIALHDWQAEYKFPGKPQEDVSSEAKPDNGEPTTVAPCKGCKFVTKFDDQEYCMRPACWKLKQRLLDAREKAEVVRVRDTTKTTGVKRGMNGMSKSDANAEKAKADAARAKRQAERAEDHRIIIAAIETLAQQLAPTVTDGIAAVVVRSDEMYIDDDDLPEWLEKYETLCWQDRGKLSAADARRFAAGKLVYAAIDAAQRETPIGATMRQRAEWAAKLLKLKLSKGWDTPAPEAQPAAPKKKTVKSK